MSVPKPVETFYERIWNEGDLEAISDLLTEDFKFRGSLGMELQGRAAFRDYVLSVRAALADYRCEILACVSEGPHAFAKMRFAGTHVGPFRGFAPTGKPVYWPVGLGRPGGDRRGLKDQQGHSAVTGIASVWDLHCR